MDWWEGDEGEEEGWLRLEGGWVVEEEEAEEGRERGGRRWIKGREVEVGDEAILLLEDSSSCNWKREGGKEEGREGECMYGCVGRKRRRSCVLLLLLLLR